MRIPPLMPFIPLALIVAVAPAQQTQPSQSASPTLGAPAPADAVVLFDGTDWSGRWQQRDGEPSRWIVEDDRSARVSGGDAVSREPFGDFQMHLEFRCPPMPERTGQGRGNSGVYIHGVYELQVLDSFGDEPAANGCGAFYSIAAPLVNASAPGGEWQTYDIIFRAPRLDSSGTATELPRVTVLHNGVAIHANLELPATTAGGLGRAMVERGPILLQDHGDPVRYRNIWVRSLEREAMGNRP